MQQVPPVRQADGALGQARYLVAEVAVDAPGGDAGGAAQVEVAGGVGFGGRGVAGGADAGPVGVLAQEAPADVRPAVPIAAVVEVAEAAVRDRPGVTAVGPLAVEVAV